MSLPLQAAYVGFGGMFGALTRYWLEEIFIDIQFPLDVLLPNLVGCLLMGLMTAATKKQLIATLPWSPLIMTGFLGALTTFSTFTMNVATFINQHNTKYALLSIFLNIILCNLLSLGGYLLIFRCVNKSPENKIQEILMTNIAENLDKRQDDIKTRSATAVGEQEMK